MTCAKYIPEYIRKIKQFNMDEIKPSSKYRFAGSPVITFNKVTLSNFHLADGRATDADVEAWVSENPNRKAHLNGASQKLMTEFLASKKAAKVEKVEKTEEVVKKPARKPRKKKVDTEA